MSHLVVTVHGIRTYGQWQDRLGHILKVHEPDAVNYGYKYGYFSVLAFIFPPLRWLVTRRFRRALLNVVDSRQWSRIDLVGHSFGTHLIGWGLAGLDEDGHPPIHTIILAGSVLKSDFRWDNLLTQERVRRVVNECGTKDSVLLVNQLFVLFTGMAGRIGFYGMTSDRLQNRFYRFRHSDYFVGYGENDDAFMEEKWLPLLMSEGAIEAHDDRPRLSGMRGVVHGLELSLLNNAEPVKLLLYVVPLILGIVWVYDQWQRAENQTKIALSRQLAAQALQIAQNPNEVDGFYDRALLLAVEAMRIDDSPEIRGNLSRVVTQYGRDQPYLKATARIPDEDNAVYAIAFGEEEESIVGIDIRGNVVEWNILSGTMHTLRHLADVSYFESMVLSSNGRTVTSGSEEDELQIWDVSTGKSLWQHPITESKFPLALSPNANRIADFSIDGTIRLWDVASAKLLGKPIPIQSKYPRLSFSPVSEVVAVREGTGQIRLLEIASGKAVGPPLAESAATHDVSFDSPVVFSTNGALLAMGRPTGIHVWNIATGDLFVRPIKAFRGGIGAIAFSPDGKLLAAAGAEEDPTDENTFGVNLITVKVFRLDTGEQVGGPFYGHTAETGSVRIVGNLVFSRDGETLAIGRGDLQLLGIGKGLSRELARTEDYVTSLSFDLNGERLAMTGEFQNKYSIQLWDVESGDAIENSLQKSMWNHDCEVSNMVLSPHARLAATSCNDGSMQLWSLASGNMHIEPILGASRSQMLAFSPHGETLVSVGVGHNEIVLWNLETGQRRGGIATNYKSGIYGFAISPDEKTLACTSLDSDIRLWKFENGNQIGDPLSGHDDIVVDVVFSPNGKLLASASQDGTVRLWDVETQRAVGEPLRGHERWAQRVAFSPDGATLASSGLDNVRLWDVATGLQIGVPLPGSEPSIEGLVFSPSGNMLATVGTSVRLWDLDWRARACDLAGRNLTETEWQQYIGNRFLRRPTCDQYRL